MIVPATETRTTNNRYKRHFGWLGKRWSVVRLLPILFLSIVLFLTVSTTTFLCHAAGEPNEIRVGVSVDFRPYDYVDKDGRPAGAVLLLRAADLAAAREAVGSLPLVANRITSFELTEVITPGSLHDAPAPQPAS